VDSKLIGPAFTEIAQKHAGKADYLVGKIRQGGVGVWGSVPMPAQTLEEADAKVIADWLAAGAAH
jgi:cytochrome c